MIELTGRKVILDYDEYRVLVENAKASREKTMTSEEREIIADALKLFRHVYIRRMAEARGGRINGRTLSDGERTIRLLMAKFDR